MLNQFIVVGRLTDDFKLEEKNDKKVAHNTLAVPRSYKDKDGVYQTDFIPFTLFGNNAVCSSEYCKKGDVVGIKGSLQMFNKQLQVNVERVTFLTTNKSIIDENKEIDKKI